MYRTKKATSKIWIGNFYPAGAMYREAAGETVGKALVNSTASIETSIANRRNVKGHMNMLGLDAMRRVMKLVRLKIGIQPTLVFSQMAGCGMCPCSPGFMIKIEVPAVKAEALRKLFSKYRYTSLSYYEHTERGSYCVWGVRNVGLHFWGQFKNGDVGISAAGQAGVTAKAFKAIEKIIKE